MAVLAPISGLPRFRNGRLVADARALFYDAGTTTPRTVYQDAGGAPHDRPVSVTGDGNFPAVYVTGTTAYRIRVEDGQGVLLADFDNLQAEVDLGDVGEATGTYIPTGFEMAAYTTGTVAGWVRENGRTIGNAVSGATERAADDTQALFVHLWNKDATLGVSGGRGTSAEDDFAAGKQIQLPDMRGRALVGLDAMGSTSAGRLTGFGSPDLLGAAGGAPTHTLTTAELASHPHTASASTNGAHAHGGTTDAAGSHSHGGATGATGDHAHTGTTSTDGAHTHTGNTSNDGAHTHTYDRAAYNGNTVDANEGAAVRADQDSNQQTGSSGNHNHSLNINSNGAHTHSFTTSTTGNHAHCISVDGNHSHTFTTSTTGDHSHTITVAANGGGGAHNNLQPFGLRTIYIKL